MPHTRLRMRFPIAILALLAPAIQLAAGTVNPVPVDLSMSFSAAGFGVSGLVVQAQYRDPPAGVPEPNPGKLLAAVGAVLWLAGKGLRRWSRRRGARHIDPFPPSQSY